MNQLRQEIVQDNIERNANFFDEEMDKFDHWAEDVKNSLEIELRNLEQEIKARKILNLQEKVQEQRKVKNLEKRRNELRRNLYQAQDEVDERKEKLIDNIEQRMEQKWACNLDQPYRLIFVPHENPIPTDEYGKYIWIEIKGVDVTEIVDYH